MSDSGQSPIDRLRSADPVMNSSYHHADPAAMFARIVAQPRVAKVHFAQGLRLRVASAAAAAALVSVAGIAALQSAGPSLGSESASDKPAECPRMAWSRPANGSGVR